MSADNDRLTRVLEEVDSSFDDLAIEWNRIGKSFDLSYALKLLATKLAIKSYLDALSDCMTYDFDQKIIYENYSKGIKAKDTVSNALSHEKTLKKK